MLKRKPPRLVLVLVFLVLLAGGAWVFIQQSGRLVRTGETSLPGLDAEVTVRFDRWGVPHVAASSDADLFRALGYLHAGDRLTQMELGRRAASGRLAQLLGEAAVDFDVYFRTLRFPESVEALWHATSADSKAVLEAYAEGVNAWIENRGVPPGLRLLGADLEPWRPQDSLAFTMLMARDLSFWDGRPEEYRFAWLRAFGGEKLAELLGEDELHVPEEILALARDEPVPADAEEAPIASEDSGEVASFTSRLGGLLGEGALRGSNNWAVGPSRTTSGQALLANDPHLGLFLPSVWYQVQLRSPGYEAAGMTLPGTPGVVIGRGAHVAWAFTNVMLDDHDLFFERLDESGRRYLRGEEWRELEMETVTLEVRGGEPRTLTLRRTDRGPLLDAEPERGLPARSLAWTVQEPGDPVAAMLAVARSRSAEELFAATEPYVAPAQNLVAAFATGELAYTVLGAVPERLTGDGRLPSPGWDPAYGWQGLRPRATNPRVAGPPEDLLVTANHDIRPVDYDLPLVANFFGPSRADRIRGRLLSLDLWQRQAFEDLQMDITSLHATEVVEILGQIMPLDDPDAQRAMDALAEWDKRIEVSGPSALWVLVERRLLEAVFGDETRQAALEKPLGNRDRLLRLLRGEMSETWFDDVATDAVETRREVVVGALVEAWREGAERWGGDIRFWSYGEIHALTLRHRLDEVPVFGRWGRRGPFPVAGSATTVLAFGADWQGERLEIRYGPSMRWIVDWSEPERAWAVLPGGQSGHPADAHYDDQVAPYLAGELHEAPWSEAAIEAATVSTLRLVP